MMKAICWNRYGDATGLIMQEVAKPSPKPNEVLIKIHATTVTAGDCEMRSLKFSPLLKLIMRLYFGWKNPKNRILGQELSGEIEAIGENVTRFSVGDLVFGTTGFLFGAYAEYIALPEASSMTVLAHIPSNISFDAAAGIPIGGLEAYHFLKRANIQRNQKLLIIGAGGSIGTLAVQLAKYFGAHVTAVDQHSKLAMLTSIGADQVIDYTREDYTKRDQSYDIVLDIVGKSPFKKTCRIISPKGFYLISNPNIKYKLLGLIYSVISGKKIYSNPAKHTITDLHFLIERLKDGSLNPVIDRYYPLEQVSQAHIYVESGEKAGNVIIQVNA